MPIPIAIYTPSDIMDDSVRSFLMRRDVNVIEPGSDDSSAFRISSGSNHVWCHVRKKPFTETDPDIASRIRAKFDTSKITEVVMEISREPGSVDLALEFISIFNQKDIIAFDFDNDLMNKKEILYYLSLNFPTQTPRL